MDPMLSQILGGAQPLSMGAALGNLGQPVGRFDTSSGWLSNATNQPVGAQAGTPPNLNAALGQLAASHPAANFQSPAPLGFGGFNAAAGIKDITDRNSAYVNNGAALSGQAAGNPVFQQNQGLLQDYQHNLLNPSYTESPTAYLQRQAADDPASWGFLLNLLSGQGSNAPAATGGGHGASPGPGYRWDDSSGWISAAGQPSAGQAPQAQPQAPAQAQAPPTAPMGVPGPQSWQSIWGSRPDLQADYTKNQQQWGAGYTETPQQYVARQMREQGITVA